MICPVCGGNTKVCETRSEEDCVHRLRWCRKCHKKFVTIEIDEDLYKRIANVKNSKNSHPVPRPVGDRD
jgi:transcriptional regulator NrdR family protein